MPKQLQSIGIEKMPLVLEGSEAHSGTSIVTEGDAGRTFLLTLDSQPVADVRVGVYVAGGILVEPTELLFTAQTWAQPQAVTVVAVDDNVAEAVEFASIWHNSTSSDPNYVIGSELIQRVNVTVISDDSAGLLVSASELAIAEGVGGEGTYSVRL